jgi:hypothetical protein
LLDFFLVGVFGLLIEGAFFKLSDYFQSVESPSELYEAQVAFIFAVAIYQELQNRVFHTYYRTYSSRSRTRLGLSEEGNQSIYRLLVSFQSIYTLGSLRISSRQRSSIGGAGAGYARRTGLK